MQVRSNIASLLPLFKYFPLSCSRILARSYSIAHNFHGNNKKKITGNKEILINKKSFAHILKRFAFN